MKCQWMLLNLCEDHLKKSLSYWMIVFRISFYLFDKIFNFKLFFNLNFIFVKSIYKFFTSFYIIAVNIKINLSFYKCQLLEFSLLNCYHFINKFFAYQIFTKSSLSMSNRSHSSSYVFEPSQRRTEVTYRQY